MFPLGSILCLNAGYIAVSHIRHHVRRHRKRTRDMVQASRFIHVNNEVAANDGNAFVGAIKTDMHLRAVMKYTAIVINGDILCNKVVALKVLLLFCSNMKQSTSNGITGALDFTRATGSSWYTAVARTLGLIRAAGSDIYTAVIGTLSLARAAGSVCNTAVIGTLGFFRAACCGCNAAPVRAPSLAFAAFSGRWCKTVLQESLLFARSNQNALIRDESPRTLLAVALAVASLSASVYAPAIFRRRATAKKLFRVKEIKKESR